MATECCYAVAMLRTQIQLEAPKFQALRLLAKRRSTSVAQLVREGVELVLRDADQDSSREDIWQAVGAFTSPDGDVPVAVQHDRFLAEAHGRKLRRKR
jgi:hypothetical protein